jgi:CBASS immunity sensor of nucleotide second messenger signals
MAEFWNPTRQHTLRYLQGPQVWSTDAPRASISELRVQRTPLGQGEDLAVAVGVAVDPTADVTAYLRETGLPAGHLLVITPAEGADDQAIASAGQAVAYAQQIRRLVREELGQHPHIQRIHLFLAGPGGLALLLGHR